MTEAEVNSLVDEVWRRLLSGEPGDAVLADMAQRREAALAPLRQRIADLQVVSAGAAADMARLGRRTH